MATSKGGYVSGGFDILKAPNAPTITSVTTGIASATVAFTAPTDVGGGAITSYTITAVNESTGASTGAVGAASPITVSPGGGTFKIRAAATNIYGPGRVSQYETGKQIYSGAALYSWGSNNKGQLGDGTIVNKSSPVQVGALINWLQISSGSSSGSYHVASVKTDGTLWTWGYNDAGQLGDGTVINKSSPVQVGSLTSWHQISAGQKHTASVKADGTLWAWGFGQGGRLGTGNVISRSSPVQVGALSNWYQVSAGRHTAAIKTDGTLWTWGSNDYGQLGLNISYIQYRSSPVQVGALTTWALVSASSSHTAAVKTDGTLWTWGRGTNGRLGTGNILNRSSPVQVGALTNWSKVSTGNDFTVSVKTDGTMWAWGRNIDGRVGDNTTVDRSSPVQVGALTTWSLVAAGGAHCAAVKTDGTLWSWGSNGNGRLGDGTVNSKSSPVQVGALTDWIQTAAGYDNSLAIILVP